MSDFKNWMIGASRSMNGVNNAEILKELANGKLKCIELSANYETYYGNLDFVNKSLEIKKAASEYGIILWSVHLPFSSKNDISTLNDEWREFAVNTNIEMINSAAKAGFKVAVVHPSAEPISDEERPLRFKNSKENLKILAETAKSVGMRLAVENLPRTCLGNHSGEILALMDGNPDLYCCFDTNHLLIQDNTEFIKAVNDKIITIHVSDYDFIDERHRLPLNGKNDWKAIITALETAGYNGPWIYEVSLQQENITVADLPANKRALENL